eukprot:1908300-Lingulodinium_polyedra.AAC.1
MTVSAVLARSVLSRDTSVSPAVAAADATDTCSLSSVVSAGGKGNEEDVAVLGRVLGDVDEWAAKSEWIPNSKYTPSA